MEAKHPPKPRVPDPRKRPTVIVLEDYTDADMTVQRAPLHVSDLPQFDLPPINDPIDSNSGVVLSDLDAPSRPAPPSLPPMAMDSDADRSAERFEQRLRHGAWKVRAGIAAVVAFAACGVYFITQGNVPLATHSAALADQPLKTSAAPPVSGEAIDAVLAHDKATTGVLVVDAASAREVYVDGKPAGFAGSALTITCGDHVVRVGRNGPAKDVRIPCGGEIVVSR